METPPAKALRSVIFASSVGTLIEWYDFYIFGSLAVILSEQFFPQSNPSVAFLSTLATFAAGFVVRPLGALVFGRLGDVVGRKYTFLVTLILMGGSTFLIGITPGYQSIGIFAPLIVLLLRLVQGVALGGEYGGAATYVAEYSPPEKRGFYTSFIQTTATLGLFVSLGVIVTVKSFLSDEEFADWGWRIPFLLSSFLVGISVYIRLNMKESPLFSKIKEEGKISESPLRDSFGKKENLKLVLIALFGITAGAGVVWYTGQFYALSFIQKTCSLEFVQSSYIIGIALLLGTPFFLVFGWMSDRVGRKYIMLAGLLLGAALYMPIYGAMYNLTDVNQKIVVERKDLQEDKVYVKQTFFSDGTTLNEMAQPDQSLKKEIKLGQQPFWFMILLVFVQVIFVTMVYGPIAAYLVELFPTRIRYTSMSLPYHIGFGIFGGLTPFIATSIYEVSKSNNGTGDIFAGLYYPIAVAGICLIVGLFLLPNKIKEQQD